ncbi:MAG: hypothetical protein HY744_26065 [Deltaproteobacteria bacterium]|nr:hypothetical protein [Deltaproteobacteria bacterium]
MPTGVISEAQYPGDDESFWYKTFCPNCPDPYSAVMVLPHDPQVYYGTGGGLVPAVDPAAGTRELLAQFARGERVFVPAGEPIERLAQASLPGDKLLRGVSLDPSTPSVDQQLASGSADASPQLYGVPPCVICSPLLRGNEGLALSGGLGRLFVIGGTKDGTLSGEPNGSAWVLDAESNEWQELALDPAARPGAVLAATFRFQDLAVYLVDQIAERVSLRRWRPHGALEYLAQLPSDWAALERRWLVASGDGDLLFAASRAKGAGSDSSLLARFSFERSGKLLLSGLDRRDARVLGAPIVGPAALTLGVPDPAGPRLVQYAQPVVRDTHVPRFIGSFYSYGPELEPYEHPFAVADDVPQGQVFVSDTHHVRVCRFEHDGTSPLCWGSQCNLYDGNIGFPPGYGCDLSAPGAKEPGDGQFAKLGYGPDLWRLDFDPVAKRLFVVDSYNGRIQAFAPDGTFLFKFGTPGHGPGQFRWEMDVAVDRRNGKLVVADTNSDRIQVFFDPEHNPLPELVFGSSCDLYHRYTPEDDPSCQVHPVTGELGDGQFYQPNGVAVDAQGRIWVVDTVNWRVQVFDEAGQFLFKFGAHGPGPGKLEYPVGLGIDGAGSRRGCKPERHGADLDLSRARCVATACARPWPCSASPPSPCSCSPPASPRPGRSRRFRPRRAAKAPSRCASSATRAASTARWSWRSGTPGPRPRSSAPRGCTSCRTATPRWRRSAWAQPGPSGSRTTPRGVLGTSSRSRPGPRPRSGCKYSASTRTDRPPRRSTPSTLARSGCPASCVRRSSPGRKPRSARTGAACPRPRPPSSRRCGTRATASGSGSTASAGTRRAARSYRSKSGCAANAGRCHASSDAHPRAGSARRDGRSYLWPFCRLAPIMDALCGDGF